MSKRIVLMVAGALLVATPALAAGHHKAAKAKHSPAAARTESTSTDQLNAAELSRLGGPGAAPTEPASGSSGMGLPSAGEVKDFIKRNVP
jgi:hypothetical protein